MKLFGGNSNSNIDPRCSGKVNHYLASTEQTSRVLANQRILRYWRKKYVTKQKRHVYKHHRQVAEKRLRIEGRFVTKEKAFEILGMAQQDLLDNKVIQEMLTKHSDENKRINTIVTGE